MPRKNYIRNVNSNILYIYFVSKGNTYCSYHTHNAFLKKVGLETKQRVLNDLWRARLSRGRMSLLLAHPLPPFSRCTISSTGEHRKTEKKRQHADLRGGKGAGEEPNYTTTRKPNPL
jgi:hypothetical protein